MRELDEFVGDVRSWRGVKDGNRVVWRKWVDEGRMSPSRFKDLWHRADRYLRFGCTWEEAGTYRNSELYGASRKGITPAAWRAAWQSGRLP